MWQHVFLSSEEMSNDVIVVYLFNVCGVIDWPKSGANLLFISFYFRILSRYQNIHSHIAPKTFTVVWPKNEKKISFMKLFIKIETSRRLAQCVSFDSFVAINKNVDDKHSKRNEKE